MNPMQHDQTDQGGGYTIELEVAADGSIKVCVETGAQESAESQGGADDDSNAVPAKDIADALSIAKQIYANNGKLPGGEDDAMQAAQQGYDSRAGKRMMGDGSGMGAVFGE